MEKNYFSIRISHNNLVILGDKQEHMHKN